MPPPEQLVPYFFGRGRDDEGKPEDPVEFLENIKATMEVRNHPDEAQRPVAIGVIFRLHLKERAFLWYQNLGPKVRTNWDRLEAAFLSRFRNLNRKNELDSTHFFHILFDFKQGGRSIVEYIAEGDQLNSLCPELFRDSLGYSLITGLDDRRKINLAEVLTKHKKKPPYAEAKSAVIKAHQILAERDSSNTIHNSPPPEPFTPSTQPDLAASQGPRKRKLQSLQPKDNISYRPIIAKTNSQNQTCRIQLEFGIYCHHCGEEGHYSISCTKLIVCSSRRLGINKLQEVPR